MRGRGDTGGSVGQSPAGDTAPVGTAGTRHSPGLAAGEGLGSVRCVIPNDNILFLFLIRK